MPGVRVKENECDAKSIHIFGFLINDKIMLERKRERERNKKKSETCSILCMYTCDCILVCL